MEIRSVSFGLLGSYVLAVFPCNFLASPKFLLSQTRAAWETKKALMLCKHCSAIMKTLVYYQHYFHYISKPQHHTCYYEEKYYSSIPSLMSMTKCIWYPANCLALSGFVWVISTQKAQVTKDHLFTLHVSNTVWKFMTLAEQEYYKCPTLSWFLPLHLFSRIG